MKTEYASNNEVLATKTTDGIAVITLGSAKHMYFDAEMGDALTENLQERACDLMKQKRSQTRPARLKLKGG